MFIVGKNDSSLLGEQQFIFVFLSLVKSRLSCSRGHMVKIQTHFMLNIFQEKIPLSWAYMIAYIHC